MVFYFQDGFSFFCLLLGKYLRIPHILPLLDFLRWKVSEVEASVVVFFFLSFPSSADGRIHLYNFNIGTKFVDLATLFFDSTSFCKARYPIIGAGDLPP